METTNELELRTSVEQNPVAVFLSSVALTSRSTYRLDLEGLSRLLGEPDPFSFSWHLLRFQHTQAIRTMLTETICNKGKLYAVSTINRKLSVLRGVLKMAWRLGLMSAEDYYRAVDVGCIRGENVSAGRELTSDEITKLINVCVNDPTMAGVRDAAIISLMVSSGLRRSELIGLKLGDYNRDTGRVIVLGKGRKERTVYLVNEAANAMEDWLWIRGDWEGPIFVPFISSFDLAPLIMTNRRMAAQSLYVMLLKRGQEAGVAHFTPHDLRRTFVSNLLAIGVDINTVAKMCGHSLISTTARYDRRSEITKKEAAKLLHVPYKSRNKPTAGVGRSEL